MTDQHKVESVVFSLVDNRLSGMMVNEIRGFPEVDVEDGPYGVFLVKETMSLVVYVRQRLAYVKRIA